jgi:hypothetical protein
LIYLYLGSPLMVIGQKSLLDIVGRRLYASGRNSFVLIAQLHYLRVWPASCSSGQSFWLLIMRSQVWFLAVPWGFFLEGEDSHGDHGLGSLVELRLRPFLVVHIHVSPSTSSGQCHCTSWASQPQKSVILQPQPGGETTKSIRDIWWHWRKVFCVCCVCGDKQW